MTTVHRCALTIDQDAIDALHGIYPQLQQTPIYSLLPQETREEHAEESNRPRLRTPPTPPSTHAQPPLSTTTAVPRSPAPPSSPLPSTPPPLSAARDEPPIRPLPDLTQPTLSPPANAPPRPSTMRVEIPVVVRETSPEDAPQTSILVFPPVSDSPLRSYASY